MIDRQSTVTVKQDAKEDFARLTTTRIGTKTIRTPCYMTKVRKDFELEVALDLGLRDDALQAVCFEADTVEDLILNGTSPRQQSLAGLARPTFGQVREKLLILVDPLTEYFYFKADERRKALGRIRDLPDVAHEMLDRSDRDTHFQCWRDLIDSGRVTRLIQWNVRFQSRAHADVIIPPVPFVDGQHKTLMDYAIDLNAKAAYEAAEVFNKEPSFYFPLNYTVFRDSEQYERIFHFLLDEDKQFGNVRLAFLKIKNLQDLMGSKGSIERSNLRTFLQLLGHVSEQAKKNIFLLDADTFGFAACSVGIDGFVEPMNMHLHDFGGGGGGPNWGRIYHPELMDVIPRDDAVQIETSNGGVYPRVRHLEDHKPIAEMAMPEWWEFRRKYLLGARMDEIHEIREGVRNHTMRHAYDKLARSGVKQLVDFLPNGY